MSRQGNLWDRLTNKYGTNDRGLATCPSCQTSILAPQDQHSTFYCKCRAMRAYVEQGRDGNLEVVVIAKLNDCGGRIIEDEVTRSRYHGRR